MTIHVVQPGETIYSIAARYGADPWLLQTDNGVPSGGALAVGQALVIQRIQTFHIVQPGQTLASIANAYGVTLRQLYRNNFRLGGQPNLRPGQLLVIAYQGEKLGKIYTNGYAYPSISPELLSATLPYMTYVAPFTYGITDQGGLLPLADQEILSQARRLGSSPLMHLSTLTESGSFSSQRATDLLSQPELQQPLTQQILSTMEGRGYQGLDVDFEFLPDDQRDNYVDYVRSLRVQLQGRSWPLFVALPPKTYDAQPGLLYEGISYFGLGQAADYLLLMTYEWGYTYGPPMAVAPLQNVRQVLDYAVTQIDPQKLFLGVPAYGYDWPLPFRQGITRAQSISNQQAVAIAVREGAEIQYDEQAQSPWFRYTDESGVIHEVWFEDARSLSAKLRLIREYSLRGAGYWNLMRPDPQGWVTLNSLYDVADA